MMNILQKLLAFFAKRILNRYKPKIIGITGSIGKTSTKEAAFMVLKDKFRVRRNVKNYNNEIGVPITIIGTETGGKSLIKWLKIFAKALKLWLIKNKKYPEVLILEMGADKPGDIRYLVDMVPLDIGVVTKVSPVHIEFFGTIEAIAKEKGQIVKNLKSNKTAILNFDDPKVKSMEHITKAKVLSYGYSEDSEMKVVGIDVKVEDEKVKGMSFKLSYKGSTIPMMLPGVIGRHQLYAALAGAAIGVAMGMNMVDIGQTLKKYRSPKGRMRVIEGLNNSTIIDDSYNSSPDAAHAAIDAVSKVPRRGRLIAAFGEMLELGDLAISEHQKLGEAAVKAGFEKIYAVGKLAKYIRKGASMAGLSLENIKVYEKSELAAEQIKKDLRDSDLILVKGSQGPRMEKVAKALMAHPERASQLLVRQSKAWLRK